MESPVRHLHSPAAVEWIVPMPCSSPSSSYHDLTNRRPIVDVQPAPSRHLEPPRVDAELMHDGGVDVRDVMAVLDGVETEFISRAVDDAPLDAAAGEPGAEARRV